MQFQVPQFIEVEDKIFGPFTLKQFIYMAGGGGLAFVLWKELPLFLALPLICGVLGFAAALGFMEYNKRPFIIGLENAFYFMIRGKLYLWSSEKKYVNKRKLAEESLAAQPVHIPTLSDSKLHDLAWSLDIKEKVENARRAEPSIGAQNQLRFMRSSSEGKLQ